METIHMLGLAGSLVLLYFCSVLFSRGRSPKREDASSKLEGRLKCTLKSANLN